MPAFLRLLPLLAMLTPPALAADRGPVTVEFPGAERYTDIRDRWVRTAPDKNLNLKALRRHLEKDATRRLPPGETLTVRFTDIDLAGDYNTPLTGPGRDIRVVTELYPPRLKFDWERRSAEGAVIASGSESLRDFAFLSHGAQRRSERLAFERRLLDQWLQKILR